MVYVVIWAVSYSLLNGRLLSVQLVANTSARRASYVCVSWGRGEGGRGGVCVWQRGGIT